MKNLIVFFLIVSAFTAKSQLVNSSDLYEKIVMLRDNNGSEEKIATGFILTDNDVYFLVTANHVAKSMNLYTTEIFFCDTSMYATRFRLADFIAKGIFSGFNEKSDGYILKLEPFSKTSESRLKSSAMYVGMLNNDRKSISRCVDVLVMGYPVFDFNNFAPISYRSSFASALMNIQVDSSLKPSPGYLLEHPSMQGSSGGPVFASVKDRSSVLLDKTQIIGMVSGVTGDEKGSKYTVVTPAFQLLDLIYGR